MKAISEVIDIVIAIQLRWNFEFLVSNLIKKILVIEPTI